LAERRLELLYWDEFSTPYLYAHLAHPDAPTAGLVSNWTVHQQRNDRSFMLQLLTETDGVQRLTAGAEAAELKAEWCKVHKKGAGVEAPVVSQAAAVAAQVQAPPQTPAKKKGKQAGAAGSKGHAGAGVGAPPDEQSSDHVNPPGQSPSSNKKSTPAKKSGPASNHLRSPPGGPDRSEDEEDEDEDDDGGASPAAAASASSSSKRREWPKNKCKCCLLNCDFSASELEFGWFCPNPRCGLRGDLSPNEAYNQLQILERINKCNNNGVAANGAKPAASPSSSSSSSSSSSGQSSTQPLASASADQSGLNAAFSAISALAAATAAAVSSKDSRERDSSGSLEAHFAKLIRSSPIMTQWKGPTASLPISPMTAMQWGREAFEAVARERHAEGLMEVVQEGKLSAKLLGLCFPRKREEDGSSSSSLNSLVIPPLASPFEFTIALLGFILPCLASQPAAMFDWMFFGVAILEIAEDKGWRAAQECMNRVLNVQVADAALNTDVKTCGNILRKLEPTAILRVVAQPKLSAARAADSGAGAGAGGQQRRSNGPPCFIWNRNNMHCDFGSNCRKSHVCHTCRREGHTAFDRQCPQYEDRSLDQAAAPRQSGGSNNPQGGNKCEGGGKGGKRHDGGSKKGAAAASGNSNGGAGGSSNKEQ
jgi:hypothetical protein